MSLGDLFYPRFCFGCGHLGSYLCLRCEKILPTLNNICFYCNKKSGYGLTHEFCKKRGGVDGFICLYKYSDIFKRIIKRIKYSLIKNSTIEIFPLFLIKAVESVSFYKKSFPGIQIQTTPLFHSREKRRGFNQASIICQHLSLFFNLKQSNLIKRVKKTQPQAELTTPGGRIENIKGAFEIENYTHIPKNILIVDDVVTTGSTARELTFILKKHGAERVFVFSLAKG